MLHHYNMNLVLIKCEMLDEVMVNLDHVAIAHKDGDAILLRTFDNKILAVTKTPIREIYRNYIYNEVHKFTQIPVSMPSEGSGLNTDEVPF